MRTGCDALEPCIFLTCLRNLLPCRRWSLPWAACASSDGHPSPAVLLPPFPWQSSAMETLCHKSESCWMPRGTATLKTAGDGKRSSSERFECSQFWLPSPPFFTLFVSSLPWQLTAGSIFFVSRYGDGLPVPSGNTPRPQPRWWSYKWRHEGLFFTNTVSFFLAWPEREHVSGALVLLPFSFNLSSALVNGMFLVLEMFLVYLCTALHTIRKAVGFILNAMFCCHYGGGSLFYCHRTTSVVK